MKGLNLDPFDPLPIQQGYHSKIEEIALDMTTVRCILNWWLRK